MKTFRLILTFLALGFAFASCQKDYSFEGGNAKGSLAKTPAGDCDPILVNGLYYQDTILKATNYVDVTIDFSKIGIYNIKTDTINGYSFIASGSTGTLGPNTIRLFGKGKPLAAGFNIFTVKYDGTQCTFSVQVQIGAGGGGGGGTTNAVYTFGGAPATCTGATLGGTYISGVPMIPANNVTIPVNVTAVGPYSITTTANGVTFSGSGMLNTVGVASIILTAIGTPPISTTAVITNYPITSGTSNCSFNVNYAATPAGGAAVFTYNCTATSPTIFGTFQVGVNTLGNSITFPITLTTPGTYNLSIPAVNGVSFTGAGFLAAGATTVTLLASGTGTAAAAPFTNFSIGIAPNNCSITVPFAVAAPAGTLTFLNGTTLKTFNVNQFADTTFFPAAPPLPGLYKLDISGDVNLTSPESISINITKPSVFSPGPFDVNSLATGVQLGIAYTDNTNIDFRILSGSTPQTPGFTVIITSLTATRVVGTFFGTLKSMAGVPYVITGGIFDLPL